MHALRTTLILGAFWLLIFLVGGYQVHFRMKAEQKKLAAKEEEARVQLEESELLATSLPSVQEELERAAHLWTYRSKAIPKTESSYETYDYLDQILTRQKSSVNFDYLAAEVGDTNSVRSANYRLIGEASFIDLYRFIWYVEHLPRYLRLNSMQLAEAKEGEEDPDNVKTEHWVKFEMSLTALSADRDGFGEIQFAAQTTAPEECFDPFKPPEKIVVTVPENVLGLPNVFESALKAMTPTQIYLLDQKGELKVLSLGDEVYLGRLIDIIPDDNLAVFDLDQLIPPREVSLQIKMGK